MSTTDDQLVADYLRRLAAAADSLPADRRDELVEEITAHIAEARALSPKESGGPMTSVADMLSRLGQPDAIVRAAAEAGYGPAGYEPGASGPGGFGPGGPYPSWPGGSSPTGRPPSGMGALEISAVTLLLAGGFLAGVGWFVGVILLWLSPRWRLSDKLLGTLIWPGGLVGALIVAGGGGAFFATGSGASTCFGSSGPDNRATQHCTTPPAGIPGWLTTLLVIAAVVVIVGGPILVAIRLVRQARRAEQHYPAAA
ncbi:MAG TPA: hypothetical protein VGI66_19195 [Streptosporangiaceae bacterium]